MKQTKAFTPLEINCNKTRLRPDDTSGLSLTGLTPLEIQQSKTNLRSPKGDLSLTGLTLIELLIASSIFVVVIVTIYSAFHSGIFGYHNIEETIDVYQAARSILERINLDLRNSFVYKDDDTKFSGSQNEICFLTLVDKFRQDRLLQELAFLSYKLEKDKLMRLCRKNQEALKENSEIQPEEMADNVEIKFEYGYNPPGKDEIEFKASWPSPDIPDGQKLLPVAVKVNLTVKEKVEQKFERTIYLPLAE